MNKQMNHEKTKDFLLSVAGLGATSVTNNIAHHSAVEWQVFAYMATIILAVLTGIYTIIKMIISIDGWWRERKKSIQTKKHKGKHGNSIQDTILED